MCVRFQDQVHQLPAPEPIPEAPPTSKQMLQQNAPTERKNRRSH